MARIELPLTVRVAIPEVKLPPVQKASTKASFPTVYVAPPIAATQLVVQADAGGVPLEMAFLLNVDDAGPLRDAHYFDRNYSETYVDFGFVAEIFSYDFDRSSLVDIASTVDVVALTVGALQSESTLSFEELSLAIAQDGLEAVALLEVFSVDFSNATLELISSAELFSAASAREEVDLASSAEVFTIQGATSPSDTAPSVDALSASSASVNADVVPSGETATLHLQSYAISDYFADDYVGTKLVI
jgi:hypothetical protein